MILNVSESGLISVSLDADEKGTVKTFMGQTDFDWLQKNGDNAMLPIGEENWHVTLCPFQHFKGVYAFGKEIGITKKAMVSHVARVVETVGGEYPHLPLFRLDNIGTAVRSPQQNPSPVERRSSFISLKEQTAWHALYAHIRVAVAGMLVGLTTTDLYSDDALCGKLHEASRLLQPRDVLFHVSISSLTGEGTDAVGNINHRDLAQSLMFMPNNGASTTVPTTAN